MAIKLYPDNDQPKPIQIMSHFPIILIPPQIGQVKSAQPPVPEPPTPPRQPEPEPKKLNTILIAVEAAIAAIGVPIVSQMTSIPGWLLFVLAVGAIAFHARYQIKTYPERKQKHNDEVADYPRKLEETRRQYEEQVKEASSPERVAEFRYNKLREILNQTIPYDGRDSTATKNSEEDKFSNNYLNKYFPGKIYTGLTLEIPDFPKPYTPDFAYIDEELNFYIDIELDEPYAYRNSEPIHFLGAMKDNNRNNFFINKGWLVIRFSEEQVVCYPESCCKTVAQVIAEITVNTSILNQFTQIPDLQAQQQWTQAQAGQMALRRDRDRYRS